MGTKKGRIYDKEAPFKGVPQRFGWAVAPNCPPGSATAHTHTHTPVCELHLTCFCLMNISSWLCACMEVWLVTCVTY